MRAAAALAAALAVSAATPATAAAQAAPAGAARDLVVGPGQPYATLVDALAAARDGDTIALAGGVHRGPVVVERAVAIVGTDGAVIDGGGDGTVVTLRAEGASLTGLTIRNSGGRNDREDAGVAAYAPATIRDNRLEDVLYGIDLQRAPGSVVVGNTVIGRDLPMPRRGDAIRFWESAGARLEGNTIDRGRDVVVWYSDNVIVRDNVVTASRYGLHFMYATGSQVEGNRLHRNYVGAYAMYSADLVYRGNQLTGNFGPSGYGLALKESSAIDIEGNVVAGNRTGIYFDNSPLDPNTTNVVSGNTIAYNDIGLAFVPSVKRNVFRGNRFIDNLQQVAVVTSGTFEGNIWTDDGVGNYWSNYAGFDAEGDGIGDVPHAEVSLFHSLLQDHAALRLFTLSPAQSALDLAARAFPAFRPAPTLVDSAPFTRPPAATLTVPPPSRAPLGAFAAVCLAAAAAAVRWGGRLGVAPRPAVTARPGSPA